jgi:hypothetical protein
VRLKSDQFVLLASPEVEHSNAETRFMPAAISRSRWAAIAGSISTLRLSGSRERRVAAPDPGVRATAFVLDCPRDCRCAGRGCGHDARTDRRGQSDLDWASTRLAAPVRLRAPSAEEV